METEAETGVLRPQARTRLDLGFPGPWTRRGHRLSSQTTCFLGPPCSPSGNLVHQHFYLAALWLFTCPAGPPALFRLWQQLGGPRGGNPCSCPPGLASSAGGTWFPHLSSGTN